MYTYTFERSRVTWNDARDACERLGGHLATISSDLENELAWEMVNQGGGHIGGGTWIGLSDRAREGVWEWAAEDAASTYRNWAPREPNNQGRGEDCAALYEVSAVRQQTPHEHSPLCPLPLFLSASLSRERTCTHPHHLAGMTVRGR